jgi:hypothetical protein
MLPKAVFFLCAAAAALPMLLFLAYSTYSTSTC